ncbi:shikimate dehydrogenase [Paucilactobacillus nenjiangensis]|uniref:Shikimate dehydrogenase (NADP(+)) n=1 Tax=Paucilactobacillus nenjiangensis TaxID=1296540 RepID=A0A5P1X278_9LACO|nr:shikimate dehydrogenase [Paucilactobacillus nenjiangensis]QER66779.1 shikimate dehydrogenase [Paucilactobacillus nenjiangensis]
MTKRIEVDGHTELYGLFAHPAKHSLSPLMHNHSFEKNGINAKYLAFDIGPDDTQAAIQAIKTLDLKGVNLSMPFKQKVIPYLDHITERAKLLQSVNVIKNEQGVLTGDSVDGAGFFESLEASGINPKHQTLTIFGAGGAGLSIIQAAIDHGAKEINVFKRHGKNFDTVKHQLELMNDGHAGDVNLIDYDDETTMIEKIKVSQIVINSTNLGMGDYQAQMPAPPGVLAALTNQVVCDVIYSPAKTKFLEFAKEQGCTIFNGLGMLVYQGALSFKWWTNTEMPVDEIKQLILER